MLRRLFSSDAVTKIQKLKGHLVQLKKRGTLAVTLNDHSTGLNNKEMKKEHDQLRTLAILREAKRMELQSSTYGIRKSHFTILPTNGS